MKKTLLKQLILASYKNGELDEEMALNIADRLDRSGLKQYISALQQSEKLRTIIVDMPIENVKDYLEEFEKLFPDKKIHVRNDPSLLAGIRITNNDDIFEMNLKHNLDAIIDQVSSD